MAKKTNNLKDMSGGEIEKKLIALQEEIRVIRFKASGAKSKNVKEIATLKKQVAQAKTFLNKTK